MIRPVAGIGKLPAPQKARQDFIEIVDSIKAVDFWDLGGLAKLGSGLRDNDCGVLHSKARKVKAHNRRALRK